MNNGLVTTSIDEIVRSMLMEMNLPIHFYFRVATIGVRVSRDLNIGMLPYIKTVRLEVDALREVNIPTDLVDWIVVGRENGRKIVPLGENKSYNRLESTDGLAYLESGSHNTLINSSFNAFSFAGSINDYAEINGKIFGVGNADRNDIFKFVPERGKLLVGSAFSEGDTVYMEYVAYSKSQFFAGIPVVAAPFIEQSIRFNLARYDRTGRLGDTNREQQVLISEKRKLKAALRSIDKETMLRLFRSNFKQSIKS